MFRSAIKVPFAVVLVLLAGVASAQSPPQPKSSSTAERLDAPVAFLYEKTPLLVVIEDLKKRLSVPIVLEAKVLEEAGINLDFPITGESNKEPALASVNLLLNPFGIEAEISHDVLFVSTVAAHSKRLVGRCYRVKEGKGAEALAVKFESQITNSSWESGGGSGNAVALGPGVKMIYQTELHLREIEKKFAREVVAVRAPADGVEGLMPTKGKDPLAKLRRSFRRSASAEYTESPFHELAAHFAKANQVEIVVDHEALTAASINEKTPVSVRFKNLPLESVLTLTMDSLGIAWTVEDDKLLLTAPKSVRPITVVYEVGDLVSATNAKGLSAALMKTVEPATWKDASGQKKIVAGEAELAITQSVQVHRTIETWLADLRSALKPVPGEK